VSANRWVQLQTEVPLKQTESTEDAMLELGAVSVTLQDAADQPILEPGVGETPLWDSCVVKALFPSTIDTDAVSLQLKSQLQPQLDAELRWELLEDKDWSQEWKKYFKPLKCGHRLWIVPVGLMHQIPMVSIYYWTPGWPLAPAVIPQPISAYAGWTSRISRVKL